MSASAVGRVCGRGEGGEVAPEAEEGCGAVWRGAPLQAFVWAGGASPLFSMSFFALPLSFAAFAPLFSLYQTLPAAAVKGLGSFVREAMVAVEVTNADGRQPRADREEQRAESIKQRVDSREQRADSR